MSLDAMLKSAGIELKMDMSDEEDLGSYRTADTLASHAPYLTSPSFYYIFSCYYRGRAC